MNTLFQHHPTPSLPTYHPTVLYTLIPSSYFSVLKVPTIATYTLMILQWQNSIKSSQTDSLRKIHQITFEILYTFLALFIKAKHSPSKPPWFQYHTNTMWYLVSTDCENFKQSLLSSSLLLSRGKYPYTSRTPKIDCCLHMNPTHNQSDISCNFTSYHHATHYGQSHYLPQGIEVTNNTYFSQDSPWIAKPYVMTCVKCLNMWTWTSLSPTYQYLYTYLYKASSESICTFFFSWQPLIWGKIFRVANTVPACETMSTDGLNLALSIWAGNMAVPFFVLPRKNTDLG